MTTYRRIVFGCVLLIMFGFAIVFGSAVESFSLRLVGSICGAWLIARVRHCLMERNGRATCPSMKLRDVLDISYEHPVITPKYSSD